MLSKMRLLLMVSLAVVCFAACVTRGRAFESKTDWIKDGVTTQQDVKLIMGEPYSVGNSQGRTTWTYGYYKYRLFGKSQTKELKLYWEDGMVHHYSFNSSFKDDVTKQTKK